MMVAMAGTIVRSEELFAGVAPGIELCYQTFGDAGDDPVLLVMGLGGPMTWWRTEFCELLAAEGFFVIRYDNRDTGRSTKLGVRVRRRTLVRAFAGRPVTPPYTMADMAGDAYALLDHLDIESAHVVGVSMGGMIAQTMAVLRPHRVRSLTSIMSSVGGRGVGWQHPKLAPTMLAPRGPGRAAYAQTSAQLWRMIGSPGFPQTREEVLSRAEETWDRGFSADGVLRQMLAIVTQPDRTRDLNRLNLPAVVIHGRRDPMVHPSGGRATAAAIPGAKLMVIDGMGHDLPEALFPTFVEAIVEVARTT